MFLFYGQRFLIPLSTTIKHIFCFANNIKLNIFTTSLSDFANLFVHFVWSFQL